MTNNIQFRFVTTPSNPWGDERRQLSHQLQVRGPNLGRRQARRLSRHFALVGVHIPAARLQQLITGPPAAAAAAAADKELTDVNFALIATRYNSEKKTAKTARLQRRCKNAMICAGLVLVALNFLICLAYAFFCATQHATTM